jgi:steroid delta-isomerase-like uncharacterized protein
MGRRVQRSRRRACRSALSRTRDKLASRCRSARRRAAKHPGRSDGIFAAFPDSFTHVENLFEAGEWAMLEWSGGATWRGEFAGMPPNGKTFTLRGCGFFHVVDGQIKYQRGYWDRATWFKQLDIPV